MHPPKTAQVQASQEAIRLGLGVCLLTPFLGLSGCKENLSAPRQNQGPDVTGPVLHLSPAIDTVADSTGLLQVHLTASDRSGIKRIDFFVLPATSQYNTIAPLDTVAAVTYTIPLSQFKHGTLRYYAKSADILDQETVTDTVTVTVK